MLKRKEARKLFEAARFDVINDSSGVRAYCGAHVIECRASHIAGDDLTALTVRNTVTGGEIPCPRCDKWIIKALITDARRLADESYRTEVEAAKPASNEAALLKVLEDHPVDPDGPMKAWAVLLAFHRGDGDPEVRPIAIPREYAPAGSTADAVLEAAFMYGQNDFQPVDGCYSVSVGDVVVITAPEMSVLGEPHPKVIARVLGCGFKRIEAINLHVTGRDAQDAAYERK